jgi:hypothetical protein
MISFNLRKLAGAQGRWLTAVILATQEAEIRKITVRRQPRQIVLLDPITVKPITKRRAGGVAQGIGPEFKPQCHKKKNLDGHQGLLQAHVKEYYVVIKKRQVKCIICSNMDRSPICSFKKHDSIPFVINIII